MSSVLALLALSPLFLAFWLSRCLRANIRKNKQLQAALSVSDDRLRVITSAVPALVAYIGSDLTYKFLNDEYESWFKKPKSEMLGQTIDYVLGPKLAESVRPRIMAAMAGETQSFDVHAVLPDETERDYHASYIPDRDENGVVRGITILGYDISDRKRREVEDMKTKEALKSLSEELRRSNSELEQFAYTASHDLKEPLRNIGIYLHLLASGKSERLDSSEREYLEQAISSSKRMSNLIDALLRFSRMSLKRPEREPFSSDELFRSGVSLISSAIDEAGATVTLDPLPNIVGDREQLAQVFQNLLSNALKFRRPDVPPHIHVSSVETPHQWIFSVQDNGIGMDPSQSDRIFDPFVRLHARKTFPGHGIGLALCRKLVQQHGGSIWVESQPGEGSTFYFTLPRPQALDWSESPLTSPGIG